MNNRNQIIRIEDIQYQLYVREKVIHGIRAIDEGKLFSETDADSRIGERIALSTAEQEK